MNYGNYSTRKKRKRILLTVEEKLKIIERVEQGEDAMKLADEYNVGKTTIRDILNKKNEYLYFALNSDSYSCVRNRKTLKKSMNPELDRAVFEWFQEKRVRGESVTRQALVEAAQRLHKHMGFAEPFLASKGWLHGFKGRHGIENLEIPGEKLLTAAPHLLGGIDSPSPCPDSEENFDYTNDFEHVSVDNKEETLKDIRKLNEQKRNETDLVNNDLGLGLNVGLRGAASATESQREDDDISAFTALVASEMRKIKSEKILRKLKSEILNSVFQAEEVDENELKCQ